MGSGKTKGLLYLLQENPPERVIIVCPNTLINYWVNEIIALVQIQGVTQYEVIGFPEFAKQVNENEHFTRGAVIGVDEFHYYRNMQKNMDESLEALDEARKVFFMSGTPIVNGLSDLHYLDFFFGGKSIKEIRERTAAADEQRKADGKKLSKSKNDDEEPELDDIDDENMDEKKKDYGDTLTPEYLQKIMQDKVFVFDPKIDQPKMAEKYYPPVVDETKEVPMEWFQTFQYVLSTASKLQLGAWKVPTTSQRNSFNSLTRRISNCIPGETTSRKIQRIVQHVTKEGIYPVVIHSHYRELGVLGIEKEFWKVNDKLRIQTISGPTDTDLREEIRKTFNSRKVDVLLLTDVGGVGLDLMECTRLHKMEPSHNKPTSDQVNYRIYRIGAVKDVSKPIHFYTYASTFPTRAPRKKNDKKSKNRFVHMHGTKLTSCPRL